MGKGIDNESGRGPRMDAARREQNRVNENSNRPTVWTQDRREYGNSKLASGSKAGYASARKDAPKGMK